MNPNVSLMASCLRLMKADTRFLPSVPHEVLITRDDPGRTNIMDFFNYARAAEESTNNSQTIYIEELDNYCSDLDWYGSAQVYVPSSVDVLAREKTDLLCLAVQYGLRIYVSELLQAKKIQVSQPRGRPLLLYAFDDWKFQSGSLKMVSDLLNYGASPNELFDGQTPWEISLYKQEEVESLINLCELMLKHGADVHRVPGGDRTPLRVVLDFTVDLKANLATRKRLASLIATFLRLKADLHATNPDDRGVNLSCLDVAKRSYPEIKKVVMDHLEEQKNRKRAHSITPTGSRPVGDRRSLPRRKRNHDEDMDYQGDD